MTNTIEYTTFSFTKQCDKIKCQTTAKIGGSSKRIATYGTTRKEAKAKMEAKLAEIEMAGGFCVKNARTKETLADAVKAYNDATRLIKSNKESTIYTLNLLLKNHIAKYSIAELTPSEVKRKDIEEWLLELSEAKVSEAMRKKAYNVLSAFFRYYYRDTPSLNPCEQFTFRQKRTKADEEHVLSDTECMRFLAACDNSRERNADAVKLLFLTYMRSGELRALQVKDFLQAERKLVIKKTITKDRDGKECLGDSTKTESSMRTIDLTDEAFNIIQRRIIEMQLFHKKVDKNWFLFHSDKDFEKAMSKTQLKNRLDNLLRDANIRKEIRVHDLRHSAISFFLRHDSNIVDVSKRAGHSQVSITMNIYNHAIEESLKTQRQHEQELLKELSTSCFVKSA